MTTETVLTDEQITELYVRQGTDFVHYARAIEQAVLQSPEVAAIRRNTLLSVLGKLNSNPYSLTKSECIDIVREMFEEADAAMEKQK